VNLVILTSGDNAKNSIKMKCEIKPVVKNSLSKIVVVVKYHGLHEWHTLNQLQFCCFIVKLPPVDFL